jgi:hypothetical protein
MKTTKIYIEAPVSERLPEKEGRYIVSNGLGWFEVNYSKQFSFHEEFTDCSGVTHWLEPVEVPNHEEIETGKGFMKNEMFVIGYNRAVNWILQKLKINQK